MKRTFVTLAVALLTLPLFSQARYVFYFIGDGMGCNHVQLAEMYQAELQGRIGRQPLLMTTFPFSGQLYTYSKNKGVTDSAAAGTCLASGSKTNNKSMGLDADGHDLISIAQTMHQHGWGVGVVTTVALNHATPAAFYAHAEKRYNYYKIGTQLAQSGYNFFAGAGFYQPFDPTDYSQPNLFDVCKQYEYRFAAGYDEAIQLPSMEKTILMPDYAVQHPDQEFLELPLAIDRQPDELSLRQMVDAAITHLQDYPSFFLMVEGGKIDHSAHTNDAKALINEVMDMDSAIMRAYQFYRDHPDETLIVITADHETGGLVIGKNGENLNLKILYHQHCSEAALSDSIVALKEQWGKKLAWVQIEALLSRQLGLYGAINLSQDDDKKLQSSFRKMMSTSNADVKTLYKSVNRLAFDAVAVLNKMANVGWSARQHSACLVPLFAVGVGAERFSGWHDNSEIAPLILETTDIR